jgi:ATP/maltotriose-dependent transcriptional regulator MalT
VTLISAPAGYGKSTLASRWVAACDFPSGWVSLDESDSDLRIFLSYVLAAIRSLFPKIELRCSPEQAEQVLQRVGSHFREIGHPLAEAMVQAFQVEFSLRQGDIQKARQLSKQVGFDLRPPIWFFYVPQLTPIKLLLAEGTAKNLKEAQARLVELDERMCRLNRTSVRIDVLTLLALVCQAQCEETAALEDLRAALDLAEPGGWVRNFLDLGAPKRALLERLNEVHPATSMRTRFWRPLRPRDETVCCQAGPERPPFRFSPNAKPNFLPSWQGD